VSAVIAWREDKSMLELWEAFQFEEYRIIANVSGFSLTTRSCASWMTELSKIDSRVSVYFRAVAILHVAFKSLKRGFNDDSVDMLATLYGQTVYRACKRK